jgi:hypothetical protein
VNLPGAPTEALVAELRRHVADERLKLALARDSRPNEEEQIALLDVYEEFGR